MVPCQNVIKLSAVNCSIQMTTYKPCQIFIEKYLNFQYLVGPPLHLPRKPTRFGIDASRLVNYLSGIEFRIADVTLKSSVRFFGCTCL